MKELENINYASINLSNLRNNYNIIKKFTKPPACIICVVKADAYGHGIGLCAAALYEEGARHFAVATLAEAIKLRRLLHSDAEILIMGYTPVQYADTLTEHNIIQTIYSPEYAQMLNDHASGTVRVHVKVNTGMNRLGYESAADLEPLRHLEYEGIYTHFACSDEPDNDMTARQYNKFTDFITASGIDFNVKHAANSGAILNFPETHLTAVRAGIILYGLRSDNQSPNITHYGFKPVMTLISTVSHIHTVKKGESIGYGASFTAPRDMRIITVSIGYADGFIRAYNKGSVTVNGNLLPITGRICMDQFMADATDADTDIKIGDRVYLFGDDALMKTEEYAAFASTISYETVCTVSKRVTRDARNEDARF